MAAKDKAAKAGAAAQAAKENPYLQRIIQDEELRDNMVVAFEAARDAYSRLNNGKAPAKALIEDKKLHKDLKKSADALRDAVGGAARGAQASRRRSARVASGRLLLVAIVGGAVAIAVSEGLRNKVLDALFGAEEEFDYTSTHTGRTGRGGARELIAPPPDRRTEGAPGAPSSFPFRRPAPPRPAIERSAACVWATRLACGAAHARELQR